MQANSPVRSRAVILALALLLTIAAVTAATAAGARRGPAATTGAPATPASPASPAIPEPADDPFYQPPSGFEATAPGTILRSRPVTVTGLGIPIPVTSTQMLVRSSDAHGRPAAVASTLMIPQGPVTGPRPLLSYQPATDSLGDQCNPSYTLRQGTEKELPLIAMGLTNGWAVVVTDYEGPRNAFGAGRMAGHATLDGIRAAEGLPGTGLAGADTPVGLWGYSGGALATGWAAELQPAYAPELAVRGVAAGGIPADLETVARRDDGGPYSGLVLAASTGLSREYPELLTVLNDAGRQMIDDIGDMCVEELSASYAFRRLREFTVPTDPFSHPTVQAVLDDNRMGASPAAAAPTAPVYLYHSVFDQIIPHALAVELRSDWCAGGTAVQLRSDLLSEHITLAVTGAPGAVAYLQARFQGSPAPTNCPG